jgi:biopolymer transport protein ExbD
MTPFLVRSQIKVNLPKANAAEKESSQQNMVEILVDRNGAILIDGRTVAPDAVEATLKGLVTDLENQPVVIEADKDVPFEHVVVVMDAAKKIGVAKLGVGVKQLEPERKKEKKSQAK